VAVSCEHSCSIKIGECLDQLSDYTLLFAARKFPSQKPYTKYISAYSAFVNLGTFVVATVIVTGTTVRV
jgi:hypothetical protein